MQAVFARAESGIKIHRSKATYFGFPAAVVAPLCLCVRVPRHLRGGGGGKWCASTAAGPGGDGARGPESEETAGRRAPRPDAVASSSSPAGSKRGSVAGAVALIVGTSIGSGILAVPQRTAPAGFVPSAACMVTCWAFLVAEALLLAEINVYLRRRKNKDGNNHSCRDLDVISVKSMAQETLGEWGGNVPTTAYLFMSYTSMVAYASKFGEVLSRLVDVPEPVSGAAFTTALALLIAGGGTGVTDCVNQLLTFVMIGLLLAIEVSAVAFGGGLSLPPNSNWEQVPAALPVIIFTLVFHDMAPGTPFQQINPAQTVELEFHVPDSSEQTFEKVLKLNITDLTVICAYLGGDLARIRLSILVRSLVPLLSLLVWDEIALGFATDLHGFDILEMIKTDWSYTLVESFSLLAVGTSLIGTLLGASQFFIEQMTILPHPATQGYENINKGIAIFPKDGGSKHLGVDTILQKNKLSHIATTLVVVPTIIIAATVPNSFSIATDIAGGYCMTILYGVLPPLMAWRIVSKRFDASSAVKYEDPSKDNKGKMELTRAKPVLVGWGCSLSLWSLNKCFKTLSL